MVQLTATLVTFAEPTVPLPLVTLQVWPLGVGLDGDVVGGAGGELAWRT